ncbi:alcohol dehydrogenase catalytic domain-containing protein [Candidatus Bipolaricaulota bacterium]
MRALQLIEIGRPLEAREVPRPAFGRDDVLVKVRAAGVCHSDVHYCDGLSPIGNLPQTLGHEVSGEIEAVGANVTAPAVGARVALHYLITCGRCSYCRSSSEQFCREGQMLGKDRDGGYAEYISVPASNAIPLPDSVPFEQGAVAMCSSATVFHALRKSRLKTGESVAVFGVGGLGMSAIQLARAFGALQAYAVDIDLERLAMAGELGSVQIDASATDPVAELMRMTDQRGVDVTLELIGLPDVMRQAIQSLAPYGRAVIVGLADRPLEIDTYRELLGKEAEIIGCSDHLGAELPALLEFVRRGTLDLSRVITQTVPLEAEPVNEALDNLRKFGTGVRSVIVPC